MGMLNRNKKSIMISLIFLVIGVFVGIFLQKNYLHQSGTSYVVREGGYSFINPLLSCNISENKQFDAYKPITDKFKSYIQKSVSDGDAKDISIYFRDMNTGRWSGVNENDAYSPASLSKVPIMIAYLKKADSDPSVLKEEITYKQTVDKNVMETFKPKKFIETGKTYSVDELLRYMIIDSDNNAAGLLQDNINQQSLNEVYSDIGIPISATLTDENITPKIYSYIFRILYNATYLSKPMSQYALGMMSSDDFSDGLRNGIPATIPISDKFGERTVMTKDGTTGNLSINFRELHDCGIVYYPKSPYLLCVMTKGDDFAKLSKIISDISATVYKETASGVLKI
jgi:beta-lactamase class A